MKKLRIGLLGCGRIGIMHAENMVNLVKNVDLVAASDPYLSDQAKQKLQALGVERISKNIDDVIISDKVDALLVASPTFTHIETIRKIISKVQKPIFCEKPLSTNWGDILPLAEEIKKRNVFLQMGYNRRFDTHFKHVKEAIEKRKLEKLYLITITSYDPKAPTLDYVKASGMIWTDMNIHDFDMIRHISNAEIEEVFVHGANLVSEELIGIDVDVTTINLKLSNGALAVVKASRQTSYGYDQRIEVLGEKGGIKIDNVKLSNIQISSEKGITNKKPLYFFLQRYKQSYVDEISEFALNVLSNKKPSVSVFDDLAVSKVAFACQKSYKTGKPVKIAELKSVVEGES